MDGACDTHMRDKKYVNSYNREAWRETWEYLRKLYVDKEDNIKMSLVEIGLEGVDWI
jgi:hypothetical protein